MSDMTKSLTELFVLSACGKLAPLQVSNETVSEKPLGGLNDRGDAFHCGLQNRPAFIEGKDSLVEEPLKHSGSDSAASQRTPHCVVVLVVRHGKFSKW